MLVPPPKNPPLPGTCHTPPPKYFAARALHSSQLGLSLFKIAWFFTETFGQIAQGIGILPSFHQIDAQRFPRALI